MSGNTRQRSFVELVAQRTAQAARQDLQVYSISEVNSQIGAIDLTPYATNASVAAISGGLDNRLDVVEANTIAISANLTTDINNLDLSLSQAIIQHIQIDGTSPVTSATRYAWVRIDIISGGPFYIPIYK